MHALRDLIAGRGVSIARLFHAVCSLSVSEESIENSLQEVR